MRAGRLRTRVQVQRPVTSQSASGAETVEFVTAATVWAQIVSSTGIRQRERLLGDALLADTDTVIHMRWTPAIEEINAKWRVRYQKRAIVKLYNIIGVANVDERDRALDLQCRVGSNNG